MIVTARVFTSDKKEWQDFRLPCPKGAGLIVVSAFVEKLIKEFPQNEFQTIKIRGNRYNVVPIPLHIA